MPTPWSTLSTRQVADCRVFTVHAHQMRHEGDSREAEFFVIHAPHWVMALPLTPDGGIVLVRQFRYGTANHSWEVPGGMVDPGEDPVATAVRETREETGYTGRSARLLASASPNPAILNNRCHFVVIEDCVLTESPDLDEHEELETKVVPVSTALQWAREGIIHHTMAISALFFLERRID